ncbi:MAG TPA: GAF domain-containing protein [Candidatus Xenobia bacterium]|nr:GAF domain-containing protein [Candidatus Xenobia bacterium]
MEPSTALFELSRACLTARDLDSLLKVFTGHLGPRLRARAVLVWLRADEDSPLTCRGGWFDVGERFSPAAAPPTAGPLVDMLEATRARRLGPQEITPDVVSHLDPTDRERVRSALYAPLVSPKGVVGVVECLNKQAEFTADDAVYLEEVCRLSGPAFATHLQLEKDQRQQLATVERLTALYDIARIFNSTLELDALLPVVADKIRDICGAQAANLWLIDPEANDLYVAQKSGDDPTVDDEARVKMGEGLVGEVAQKGEGHVVADAAEDERLVERRRTSKEFELQSLMVAPLLKEDNVLGVIEVINKQDGTPFDEDDLFFLSSICDQAAIALNNANLLEAERKVHVLDALLSISKEITSTLNLDHVLATVVNQAANVVPFDRCAIGHFDRNRFILGAVSGEVEVPKTREMDRLREVMEWVATQPEAVRADNYNEGWEVSVEEGRELVTAYLDEFGFNGFYAVPLKDEQGTVGVLVLLSGDAEFLTESHIEILSILASQTTVAIRNARLYQEVPLKGVWAPLVEKKQKLVSYGRWAELGWKVGLVVLLLVVIPWKMRISANAIVVPAERRAVTAPVAGVIQKVSVREGQSVAAGAVLGVLDSSDDRVRLEQARADLALAQRELGEADIRRDSATAAQARLRVEMHQAQVALYSERVEKAEMRAPVAGIVVTPKVEELVGKRLEAGELFAELVEPDRFAVEMNVPETEIDLVREPATNPGRPGSHVALKLNTYPTHTFEGEVERVSARTVTAESEQFFVVRGVFKNDDPGHTARSGMAGRAKISAKGGWFQSGWYPVGYVLLRDPARWVWRKLWTWLP